jgi:hypothetical protein
MIFPKSILMAFGDDILDTIQEFAGNQLKVRFTLDVLPCIEKGWALMPIFSNGVHCPNCYEFAQKQESNMCLNCEHYNDNGQPVGFEHVCYADFQAWESVAKWAIVGDLAHHKLISDKAGPLHKIHWLKSELQEFLWKSGKSVPVMELALGEGGEANMPDF